MTHSIKPRVEVKKIDTKELELPDTAYIRDIEDRVFQSIILQALVKIEGISLVEGNFLDYILGRSAVEGLKGIYAEQDNKNHVVRVKVEVNVQYGVNIPQKAEEIQTQIVDEITRITGLHVASVHVVFKNMVSAERLRKQSLEPSPTTSIEEEFTDEF